MIGATRTPRRSCRMHRTPVRGEAGTGPFAGQPTPPTFAASARHPPPSDRTPPSDRPLCPESSSVTQQTRTDKPPTPSHAKGPASRRRLSWVRGRPARVVRIRARRPRTQDAGTPPVPSLFSQQTRGSGSADRNGFPPRSGSRASLRGNDGGGAGVTGSDARTSAQHRLLNVPAASGPPWHRSPDGGRIRGRGVVSRPRAACRSRPALAPGAASPVVAALTDGEVARCP